MESTRLPGTTIDGAPPQTAMLRLLGSPEWRLDGHPVAMPASRKLCALLVYLAMAERPVERSALIDLLWQRPADPRGELRWALSRLRSLLGRDPQGVPRVRSAGDVVWLALDDVDVRRVAAFGDGQAAARSTLIELEACFAGAFAEGLFVEHCAQFDAWLQGERFAWRERHIRLLERLAAGSDDVVAHRWYLRWLGLSPYDVDVHRRLIDGLLRTHRIDDAVHHVRVAARQFEEAGIDALPLRRMLIDARHHPVIVQQAERGTGARTEMAADGEARPPDRALTPRHDVVVALMPFRVEARDSGAAEWLACASHALTRDIVRQLARLRGLAVIAAASVFALQQRGICAPEAAPMLPLRRMLIDARHHPVIVQQAERGTGARTEMAADGEARPPDRALTPRHDVVVALMPFRVEARDSGAAEWLACASHALTRDIVRQLARLRGLAVIAAASVFALQQRGICAPEAAPMLAAEYIACGVLADAPGGWCVDIELIESRGWRTVWSDRFEHRTDDWRAVVDGSAEVIAAVLAGEIEAHEVDRALGKDRESPWTAWQIHHRGLGHLYRFDKHENASARSLFERAIALDPGFSRPHAGLSFAHWQDAFQRWSDDPSASARRAMDSAVAAVRADDRDPGAHCAMARALWLQGENGEAVRALRDSVTLSPSYAFAHYVLSFVQAQAGDPLDAMTASDASRRLSPYDPMRFAMLATRGIAEARLGRFESAADWAVRGARCANAHAHIHALAAFLLPFAGRMQDAWHWLAQIRRQRPGYRFDDFRAAFHFEPDAQSMFREGARRLGVD
ncbi:MAG: hypothetical protein QM674_19310 [Burkholderiaceae bacterium]